MPIDIALARLVARGRTDDESGVARDRLSIYEAETLPALALIDRHALLVRVDGDDLPDVVEQRVMRAFLRARRSDGAPASGNLRAVTSGRDHSTISVAGVDEAGRLAGQADGR